MVKKLFIFFLLSFVQANTFGQYLDFENLERLPNVINSGDHEAMPLLSPDGRTLFFVRSLNKENIGGVYSGSDVWISSLERSDWKRADNRKIPINDKNNNAVVGIGEDGKILYLLNTIPGKKVDGIYFSKKIDGSWTKPELIKIPGIKNDGFLGMYVSPDFETVILSMNILGGVGEEDMYVSTKNALGEWSLPVSLGASINTTGFEISPFLTKDKKRLYFASNGHGGFGDADIFYSDRLHASWETWTVPINLGEKVNSLGFDAYFSIYGDSLGYFVSNRNSISSDIFSVHVKTSTTPFILNEKYMTYSEINEVLGANVSSQVAFKSNQTHLSQEQQERIWFIANKIQSSREINIYLRVVSEDTKDLMAERIAIIFDLLKLAGIEIFRIHVDYDAQIKGQENGVLELLFFK